jgi:hypothetical protein
MPGGISILGILMDSEVKNWITSLQWLYEPQAFVTHHPKRSQLNTTFFNNQAPSETYLSKVIV